MTLDIGGSPPSDDVCLRCVVLYVVLFSHDVNFANSVVANVIDMPESKMTYYPGDNYHGCANQCREGISNQVFSFGALK